MTNSASGKRTAVSVSTIADCPFSIAQEYALEFFRSGKAGATESEIDLPLKAFVLRHFVDVVMRLDRDSIEMGRSHEEIRLFWDSGSPWFPNFHGTLRFRIERDKTRILLEGSYIAPLGLVGQLFDAVVGKHIARLSLSDLAQRIATYLANRQRRWLSGFDPNRPQNA
jgi:hypothetical protein